MLLDLSMPNHEPRTMFSKDLIEKCKTVFEKRAKREINDGEADLYLNRLADLGLLFVKTAAHLKSKGPAGDLTREPNQN